METHIVKWALDSIGQIPPIPVPSLVAMIILIIVVLPLVRKALRSPSDHDRHHDEGIIRQTTESPWLITTLVNIDLRQNQMALDMEKTLASLSDVSDKMDTIENLLRHRHNGSRRRR